MFSFTKCGHCNGTVTKIAEIQPSGTDFKQIAICCSSCSSILGITDYFNVGNLVKMQEKEIASLKQQVTQIDYNLRVLLERLNSR